MMVSRCELSAVEAAVFPAKLAGLFPTSMLSYRRISELVMPGTEETNQKTKVCDVPEGVSTEPVELSLDKISAGRLLAYFALETTGSNCHRFARHMAGVELTGTKRDSEPHLAPQLEEGKLEPVKSLRNGEIGSLVVANEGVVHSLVGLGEDLPYALQVMSFNGELGLADYDRVINYYRANIYPGKTVELQAVRAD